MASLDVNSVFTNMPLDESIETCVNSIQNLTEQLANAKAFAKAYLCF